VVRQLLETIRVTALILATAPLAIFGAYCAVAALVSRLEDAASDEQIAATSCTIIRLGGKASEEQDYLKDLPKAA
jgi:hypothetical protein